MIFKEGDIVVCVDNSFYFGGSESNLTLNKKYKIIYVSKDVFVINDKDELTFYSPNRFISIIIDRKMKFEKLKKKFTSSTFD